MILNKPELVIGCRSIIETLCMLVDHYGESYKFSSTSKENFIKNKTMYEKHFRFLGSVGLINEFTVNSNSIDVTISPHILGFCVDFIDQIELITDLKKDMDLDKLLRAFSEMFPQDREHCSVCCPYKEIEDEEME
jgi:hypothetical protein